jgi:hypothetical protein
VVGDWQLAAGNGVDIDLPDGGGRVSGRVVRCGSGLLAMIFRRDQATDERVLRAIEALGRRMTP